MIFAMVGTHEQPFDRLVKAVDELETSEEKVIQYGYSNFVPEHSKGFRFLDFDEVKQKMSSASAVITHAGTGSVMLALSLGKLPVVAPRYKRRAEHVDDHQLQLVESLVADGVIVPFLEEDSLAERIEEARSKQQAGRRIEPDARLVADLRTIIEGGA